MEQQCTHTVIDRAQYPLSSSILLGRIRTSEAQGNAMRGAESSSCSAIEFATIISVKTLDVTLELSSHKRMERN